MPSLHDAAWWLLAAAIAFAGAQLFWTLVTPVSPLGEWRPAGVRTMPAAARSALLTGFDPFNRGAMRADLPAVETVTGLPLTLYGVRVNAATRGGTAIIAGLDGEQALYRIGEEVMPGATLSALAFDHVVITRGSARELLYLDQSQPAANAVSVSAPAANSPARAGNPLTADALRRGIELRPRSSGGGVDGIEVASAGNGDAFRAAGFQRGDVITAINGRRIEDGADAAQLAGMMAPGATVSLTVERNGKPVPLSLTVAP